MIVSSTTDTASKNITEQIIKELHLSNPSEEYQGLGTVYEHPDLFLVTVDKECIYVDPSDIPVKSSNIIFVSKHRSAEGRAALTTHTTGNLVGEAKYGGSPGEVSWVDPLRVRSALRSLQDGVLENRLGIAITMESTHHGPTGFEVPVCFIEVGSGPEQWKDATLGKIAGRAAVVAATNKTSDRGVSEATRVVGFGGTHYPTKHTQLSLDGKYLVGHHVPKHAFESGLVLTAIRETFSKTTGGCQTALVDWKGLKGRHREQLLEWLANWAIEIVRC